MAKKLALKSFRLKNFKAIRDSGVVKFTPLTVLIGDNGSGKSSLVEGLQTYQRIASDGLDEAMQIWRGFEYIVNPPLHSDRVTRQDSPKINPIEFELSGLFFSPLFNQDFGLPNYETVLKVNKELNSEAIYIEKEIVHYRNRKVLERDSNGTIQYINKKMQFGILPGDAIISQGGLYYYANGAGDDKHFDDIKGYGIKFDWQFVTLNPWPMGNPRPIRRTAGTIRLNSDGANIAEYLNQIIRWYPEAFEGILEALQYVLPYMRDLKPVLTDILGHQMHLEMSEQDFEVPGWLLSTGTLRILALLALFRHPEPPPLIVIEEIENGLDPRSVQLIVEEIRRVTESGRSQVILTSHSPYLLDLFDLAHIVLVERQDGAPTFTRPDERQELDSWKQRFGPGRLHASGRLRNRELA